VASQINLTNNHIHARGVEFIMSAVDGSRGVRVLYCLEDISFANNFAGPEGAAAIGAVMKSNRTLKKINLAWNNIGNAGLMSLVGGIGSQHSRGKIVIAYNYFDTADLELREWFGADNSPKKILPKLGISPIESVFTGWDAAGLNDVVPA
jgi:hypothetical protein